MPDATASSRIVPDVDQSLTAQHLRHRKGLNYGQYGYAYYSLLRYWERRQLDFGTNVNDC
ncbi:hypothetical protein HSBAA_32250 [Vreelandella sulfidaeris]|uniref:Uncharacterized protein n=1 Tax=Vreelandella sulfidaeris TaxID=115553 RepID=A0A455UBL5_9GAMM|nr:hypothetical protein HSBAA_32250 [Halomonas sulfidaeris]